MTAAPAAASRRWRPCRRSRRRRARPRRSRRQRAGSPRTACSRDAAAIPASWRGLVFLFLDGGLAHRLGDQALALVGRQRLVLGPFLAQVLVLLARDARGGAEIVPGLATFLGAEVGPALHALLDARLSVGLHLRI